MIFITVTFASTKQFGNSSFSLSDDITITNASLSNLLETSYSASYPAAFNSTLTTTNDGQVSIRVPPNSFQDIYGNTNTSDASLSWTLDKTAPGMNITSTTVTNGSYVNNLNAFTLNLVSSEATTSFAIGDISGPSGDISASLSNFTKSTDRNYSVLFTPQNQGTTTLFVPAGAYTDAVGNNNVASNNFTVIVDTDPPTVAITAANQDDQVVSGSTTNDPSLTLFFTSTKQIADNTFTSSDITVVNGAISGFTKLNNTTYTGFFTPDISIGSCRINIAAGVYQSLGAGNGNLAATEFVWNVDTTEPTMNITATKLNGTTPITSGSTTNDESGNTNIYV